MKRKNVLCTALVVLIVVLGFSCATSGKARNPITASQLGLAGIIGHWANDSGNEGLNEGLIITETEIIEYFYGLRYIRKYAFNSVKSGTAYLHDEMKGEGYSTNAFSISLVVSENISGSRSGQRRPVKIGDRERLQIVLHPDGTRMLYNFDTPRLNLTHNDEIKAVENITLEELITKTDEARANAIKAQEERKAAAMERRTANMRTHAVLDIWSQRALGDPYYILTITHIDGLPPSGDMTTSGGRITAGAHAIRYLIEAEGYRPINGTINYTFEAGKTYNLVANITLGTLAIMPGPTTRGFD